MPRLFPDDPPQRLRLVRVFFASCTYGVGIGLLALCASLGLMEWPRWREVGLAFLLVNAVVWAAFLGGFNRRFHDPSLTVPQILVAVSLVAFILLRGPQLNVLAVPFYSVLFVFGMLKLSPQALAGVGAYVVLSYTLTSLARRQIYGPEIDWRSELVTGALVVCSALWFATAAGYISRLRQRLRDSLKLVEASAARDGLTGVWNRRQAEALLRSEFIRADRQGHPTCLALLDLDRFKALNDAFGHVVGDAALCHAAGTIGAALRAGDEVARWGGEEFVVLLPATALEPAQVCMERVRAALEASELAVAPGWSITCSIGIALYRAGDDVTTLVDRADQAMYRAKQAGRNCIRLAD